MSDLIAGNSVTSIRFILYVLFLGVRVLLPTPNCLFGRDDIPVLSDCRSSVVNELQSPRPLPALRGLSPPKLPPVVACNLVAEAPATQRRRVGGNVKINPSVFSSAPLGVQVASENFFS